MKQNSTTVQPLICTEATIEQLKHAIENKIPITGIISGVTHPGAHLDETAGDLVLRKTPQGNYYFPGYTDSSLTLISERKLKELNFLGEQGFYIALQRGYLLFGIGGGIFDEHQDRRGNRRSCLQKIVEYLNLNEKKSDRSVYGNILRYINAEDRNGAIVKKIAPADKDSANFKEILENFGEISSQLKKGMLAYADDLEAQSKLIGATQFLIMAEIDHQKKFLEGTEQLKAATISYIPLDFLPKKEKKRVAVLIQTKEKYAPFISKNAVIKLNNQPDKTIDLFIYVNGKHQVQMIPNPKSKEELKIVEVVKLLRVRVAEQLDLPIPTWKELCADQDPNELVFFHQEGNAIYNGSNTQRDTRGINGNKGLHIDEISKIIQVGLDETYFASDFAKKCNAGICSRNRCPLYSTGFQRCHDIRKLSKEATPKTVEAMV